MAELEERMRPGFRPHVGKETLLHGIKICRVQPQSGRQTEKLRAGSCSWAGTITPLSPVGRVSTVGLWGSSVLGHLPSPLRPSSSLALGLLPQRDDQLHIINTVYHKIEAGIVHYRLFYQKE